jgi:large conductance mechanosensitive channel
MTIRRGRRAATGFLGDFQAFILRGNVVDLAVAVIIGGAFGQIINSLIADVLTPAILSPALKATNVEDLALLQINGIKYGSFLAAVINFIVIAFVIFVLIRAMEKFNRQQEPEEAATPNTQDRLVNVLESLEQKL